MVVVDGGGGGVGGSGSGGGGGARGEQQKQQHQKQHQKHRAMCVFDPRVDLLFGILKVLLGPPLVIRCIDVLAVLGHRHIGVKRRRIGKVAQPRLLRHNRVGLTTLLRDGRLPTSVRIPGGCRVRGCGWERSCVGLDA